MENKNSKSKSSIVIEAEKIINEYLKKREMTNVSNFEKLELKYERLKITFIVSYISFAVYFFINIVLK